MVHAWCTTGRVLAPCSRLVYDLVMAVAAGHHTVAEVADRLRRLDHRPR
jgi:hypothetical protein